MSLKLVLLLPLLQHGAAFAPSRAARPARDLSRAAKKLPSRPEWKERGTGDSKLLQHKAVGLWWGARASEAGLEAEGVRGWNSVACTAFR